MNVVDSKPHTRISLNSSLKPKADYATQKQDDRMRCLKEDVQNGGGLVEDRLARFPDAQRGQGETGLTKEFKVCPLHLLP